MENYYFPLFLVVMAAVVIWIFRRVGSGRRSSTSRVSKTPAGRIANADRLHRNTDRLGPSAKRRLSTAAKPKDIWQPRRDRAAKDSFAETAARRGTHHAGYIGPHADAERRYGRYELKDQDISKSEHSGIDEYLSNRERERAKAEAEAKAKEAGGLSMTAMKYEPADASSESAEERKKRAGFKP
jgi:hypothetical protein